jgi:hypothetical protein
MKRKRIGNKRLLYIRVQGGCEGAGEGASRGQVTPTVNFKGDTRLLPSISAAAPTSSLLLQVM